MAVADALPTDGFGNFHGLDIQIRLEFEPTKSVLFDLVTSVGGLNEWFNEERAENRSARQSRYFRITRYDTLSMVELKLWFDHAPELEKKNGSGFYGGAPGTSLL